MQWPRGNCSKFLLYYIFLFAHNDYHSLFRNNCMQLKMQNDAWNGFYVRRFGVISFSSLTKSYLRSAFKIIPQLKFSFLLVILIFWTCCSEHVLKKDSPNSSIFSQNDQIAAFAPIASKVRAAKQRFSAYIPHNNFRLVCLAVHCKNWL